MWSVFQTIVYRTPDLRKIVLMKLKEVDKHIHIIDYYDHFMSKNYCDVLVEKLKIFNKEITLETKNANISFSIIDDSRSVDELMNTIFKAVKSSEELYIDTFSQPSGLGKILEKNINDKEKRIIILKTTKWNSLYKGLRDVESLIKIDGVISNVDKFCSLFWIKLDWNAHYRNKFEELKKTPKELIGSLLDFDTNEVGELVKAKKSLNIEHSTFSSITSLLNKKKQGLKLPKNIYNPKIRTPELYDELIRLHCECTKFMKKKGSRVEDFLKTKSNRTQVQRKLYLSLYILENTDSFAFGL